MGLLILNALRWLGSSIEEDGIIRKVSSRKVSMMYLHLLLTFMVVTTGAANDWNYPDEIWYLISIGSMGYSAMRVWDKKVTTKQEIKQDKQDEAI